MFKEQIKDDLSFIYLNIILLEAVQCGHKGIDTVSNNTQVGRGS